MTLLVSARRVFRQCWEWRTNQQSKDSIRGAPGDAAGDVGDSLPKYNIGHRPSVGHHNHGTPTQMDQVYREPIPTLKNG
ncbi:unnamed protein product [Heligmosomoides polygyrus]|uniref:Secreted protein n=1 Tax=Heligmosomoides polygyrus TaxID=6339 RepID=A0A183FYT3_HELPZ|nr:unnamed protein product [Heligmosomoides polygyrus]